MITGYNTDVRHNDAILHVQTEDKGLSNPLIESLVYFGGRVLVARRVGYRDLLAAGSGEKEIVALMDRQHRTMIAAIRSGKFDDKIVALQSSAGTVPVAPEATVAAAQAEALEEALGAVPGAEAGEELDRTLDQVILEYLTHEAQQEQLVLLMEEQIGVSLGSRAEVALRASSSKTGQGVPGTSVTVRLISTADEPKILGSGRTEEDGLLRLEFDIPPLGRGTSALIITAASVLGRAEIKQLL